MTPRSDADALADYVIFEGGVRRWYSSLVAGSVDAGRLLFVRAASKPAPFSASP
ncbi:MAG: hypothetical protein ACRDRX_25700 [Pseudonocardiaceae bacterium]